MSTERHIFVTPQGPELTWVEKRFCAVCGQYAAHEVHYRTLDQAAGRSE
jgi:hypothetical protein